mmetsp:Transcript_20100/g.24769  ORF Transcript_20100/g.24769 Transcript_20100/m.24769 type:complete len:213 (+) Transcript_20100:94-732(+)
MDKDLVWQRCLGSSFTSRIMRKHDSDADAEHTLAKGDVPDAHVDVLALRLARLDHVTVRELHLLCTRTTDLAADAAFHTLGSAFHNEADDAIACTAHSKATNKLEAQRLALRNRTEAAVGNLLSKQLDRVLREVPALLNDSSEFANAPALLTEHILRACRADDHLSAHRRHTDLHTRVAVLSELTSQKLVQLSKENAISDELPLLADLRSHD